MKRNINEIENEPKKKKGEVSEKPKVSSLKRSLKFIHIQPD